MMLYLIILLQVLLVGINGIKIMQMETLCSSSACYTVHLEKVDFERALENCKTNGGNLATVKNSEEESELQLLLSRISTEQSTDSLQFWIGLHLRKGDCTHALSPLKGFAWLSVDEVAHYSNWKEDPMTTCTAQRCVTLQYNQFSVNSDNFKWSDRTCKKDADGYLCKFNFKGMCKTIHLAGPGEVLYTTPFVTKPLNSSTAFLPLVPHGTFASVYCKEENNLYGICTNKDGLFGWTISGPFCDSHKLGCSFRNGECDHICVDEGAGRHRCECNDGYQLGEDKLSCIIRDYCQPLPCEYQCIAHFKGFECKCPSGFELADNQKNCTDIDECLNRPCDQSCINTHGSFTCQCTNEYELVSGRCHDVDECITPVCSQGCLNSPGSFSCYCSEGYTLAENGQSCVDIDECQGYTNPCEDICKNSPGSFKCSCKEKFTIAPDGVSCIPEQNLEATTIAAEGTNRPVNIPNNKDNLVTATLAPAFTSGGISSSEINQIELTRTTDQQWQISTTATVKSYPPNEEHHDPFNESGNQEHLVNGADKSLVLASVLGPVVVLLLLIAAVTSLVLCRRKALKKDANKGKTATDNYCWMSSGNKTTIRQTKDCPTEHV